MNSRAVFAYVASIAIGNFYFVGGFVLAAERLPQQLSEALASNAAQLDPLTVSWRQKRTTLLPANKLLSMLLPDRAEGDDTFFSPVFVEFEYQNGMSRLNIDLTFANTERKFDGDVSTLSPEEVRNLPHVFLGTSTIRMEVAFDGEKVYDGQSSESGRPAMLRIETPEEEPNSARQGRSAEGHPIDFLRFAGFRIPLSLSDFREPRIRSHVLELLEHGAQLVSSEEVTVSGTRLLRLTIDKTELRTVIDLDPALNYAVVRSEEWAGGNLLRLAVLTEHVKVSPSGTCWFPMRGEAKWYQWFGRPGLPQKDPIFTESYSVSTLENGRIPVDEFKLVYDQPGTLIGDGTLPGAGNLADGQVSYTVPADANLLDQAIQEAIGRNLPVGQSGSRRRMFAVALIAVNVIALLLLAVMHLRKKRRKT